MKTVGFGIVGCGFFGGGFARIINNLEGARTVAVNGGSRAQALAGELGCDMYEDPEEMMASADIDAVIVASPNHVHKHPVVLAAKHGKHVFCEKPIALTATDCNEMINACKENQVLFMSGHIMNFMNGVQRVKGWIDSGQIGRPIVVHSERTGWEPKQANVSWKKNMATSGGHLFHHIHDHI
jgi:predicted dehydrogenase